MKSQVIDIAGEKYGRLSVLSFSEIRKHVAYWNVRCDCGKELVVSSNALRTGNTKSCGCWLKDHPTRLKHGKRYTRLNRVYKGMKERCYSPNHKKYSFYGGQGIGICREWLGENGFQNFYDWAYSNGYKEDIASNGVNRITLDRIDGTKDYSPENCRWVTMEEQQNNRKDNHVLTYNEDTLSVSRMARKYGLNPSVLEGRIRLGWDIEKALFTPTAKRRKKSE